MISIIIGTLNHLEDCTKPCIESILKYTDTENLEIIIVDNGSKDGTFEYFKDLHPAIKCISYPEPLGYAKANNIGIKFSKGEHIILLNNDCVLLEQSKNLWIHRMMKPFLDDKYCSVSGPMRGWSDPADCDFMIFFCVMISRECFDRIGLLDESFREGGGEDTEFCIRAEKAGFKTYQVPSNERLHSAKTFMVGDFPVFHPGERTVYDLKNWNEIFKRNSDLLRVRFNRRWHLSNNCERFVCGKNHEIPPREMTRYLWAKEQLIKSGAKKVLEIGCSSGYGVRIIGDVIDEYLGIDYDSKIIEYAKENFERLNIRFQHADINTFKLEQYDAIIIFECLEHLDNGKSTAQMLKNHCKLLLCSAPYNETPGLWGMHHKLHNLTEADFPGFEYECILENGNIQKELVDSQGKSLMLMRWTNA